MNITEEIERSFGTGPELPSPVDRLAAGKSAVRRRRITGAVAALAVVGALGGTAYTLAADQGQGRTEQTQVTTNPDLPIDPAALEPGHIVGYDDAGTLVRRDAGITVSKLVEDPADLDGAPNAAMVWERNGESLWLFVYRNPDSSYYRVEGAGDVPEKTFEAWVGSLATWRPDQPAWLAGEVLHLAPGATVLERVDHPLGESAAEPSVGLALEHDGGVTWMLLMGSGSHHENDPAESDYPNFRMWLDFSVALQTGQDMLALVRFDADHNLVARDGVTLIRQLANPQVGPDLAPPGVPTAVAEVSYQGRTWFVMARHFPGESPEYFPTVAKPGRATMDEYLAHARVEYSGNQ